MRNAVKRVAVLMACSALIAATPAQAEDAFSGFYIGLQGGHQQTVSDVSDQVFTQFLAIQNEPEAIGQPIEDSLILDGFIGGAHLGYNHRMGSFVIGVEADFELSEGEDSITDLFLGNGDFDFFADTDVSEDFQGSVRARLGYVADRALFYATGGLAFAQLDYRIAMNNVSQDDVVTVFLDDDFSDLAIGFTLGAGVEYLITDRISFGAEYRYTNYGAVSENLAQVANVEGQDVLTLRNPDFDIETHAIRARLTFHFN